MSQPDQNLSPWAPVQSRLTRARAAAQPSSDLTQPLTSVQVWVSLNLQQQARVSQALIALCCQIAAEVAQPAPSGSGNQEGGDEQD